MTSNGQLAQDSELRELVDSFPTGIVHSFGYGSGVFSQQLHNQADKAVAPPMLDLILVVNDAKEWHTQNIRWHPHHYSVPCRLLGGGFCATLQRNYGAGVFFHALVEQRERLIKYGVVQTQELKSDLKEWDCLYLAGRMHKPTLAISRNDEIQDLQENYNLPYALATSFLLLSKEHKSVSREQLYEQIANLSYAGDIRMSVGGEDPDKVMKLVHSPGQLQRFYELYKHPLKQMEAQGLINILGDRLEWDSTTSGKIALWNKLPKRLISGVDESSMTPQHLASALVSIVAPAARNQSIKGIVTAGFVRSLRYAGAKFAKGAFRNLA